MKFVKSFDCLKLTSAPILGYADFSIPFELHVGTNLVSVLSCTKMEKKESYSISKFEKNDLIHKLEFLALKWSICEKFHDYFYGARFEVFTDNNPLTYILTTAKLDSTGHRWLEELNNCP